MPQSETPLVAQLVKVHTSLPFDQVISRLDKEINKEGNAEIMQRIKAAKDQNEVDALISKNLGKSGYLYISEISYHHLKRSEAQPKLMTYVIGNPLIAKSIVLSNPYASLQVPLRLMIAEKPERKGTTVAYYRPSSVKSQSDEGKGNDEALNDFLDGRVQRLVSRVTQVEDTARSRL